ncbi:unnamed protein product [Rotaria sordida]|uniref:histone deacetylase n=1 Tax=Rotaria sordida TaxID=392033 RepID=A0A819BHE5_9BILA|nr:unnamed protein product [Rotaria sordida]CAF3801235.1 unnamed protein product [Rotaria sordida]
MDDEDAQDFADFFDIAQSSVNTTVSVERKSDYRPISLPSSISEILKTWTSTSSAALASSRVGIAPCDFISFNGMFEHTWGEGHVEQLHRLTSIIDYLHKNFWLGHQSRWKCLSGRTITDEEIRLVHSDTFLSGFLAVERGEIVDDVMSMRTLSYANANYNFKSVGPIIARACRIAAGTTLDLVSSIVRGEIEFGIALVRPAGHHSSTDQVGTFCGLNSVAIAAVYAIQILEVPRVLILDWDVHRSGGTEEIIGRISNDDQQKYRLIDIYAAFGKNSSSTNRSSNCYLIDLSQNDQLPRDEEYLETFDTKVLPDIVQFSPSLIVISAGFDAAKDEAEECARLTPNGFFRMSNKLKKLNIPLVFVLEGGYREQSLVQSIGATLKALMDL